MSGSLSNTKISNTRNKGTSLGCMGEMSAKIVSKSKSYAKPDGICELVLIIPVFNVFYKLSQRRIFPYIPKMPHSCLSVFLNPIASLCCAFNFLASNHIIPGLTSICFPLHCLHYYATGHGNFLRSVYLFTI